MGIGEFEKTTNNDNYINNYKAKIKTNDEIRLEYFAKNNKTKPIPIPK